MTRKFWGMIMLFSLLITSVAAYFWFDKMAKAEQSQMVPEPPAAAPAPAAPVAPEPVQKAPDEKPEAPAKQVHSDSSTRNILFRFPRATAKSVYIVGDFNDWHRQPFKKSSKGWEVSVALKPGTYQYMFVVDDKRVKDPNNKNTASGKSVINVKPK